jgi:hypothetical protein
VTEFSALSAAAAGMEAQRAALDVDAHNVAAAETGSTFDRLVPRFAVAPSGGRFDPMGVEHGGPDPIEVLEARNPLDPASAPMDFTSLAEGDEPFIRFTGTATERGTGVDAITEMVAVLNAQRAYEADASVFEAGKRLAERTIDVERI